MFLSTLRRNRRPFHDAGNASPLAEHLEPRAYLSAALVKDVNATPDFNNTTVPRNEYGFHELNGALLFAARQANRPALYRSDGTAAGTSVLHDIHASTETGKAVVVGDVLFFAATTEQGGQELWKTDGTPGGLALVKDINPGPSGSSPSVLTNVNGTLYFAANDPEHGQALWKSDGTEAGTTLVYDTILGPVSGPILEIAAAGNTVFFSTAYVPFTPPNHSYAGGLFKTDGTPSGTVLLTESGNRRLTPLGQKLLFIGGGGFEPGERLWVTDGTVDGTFRLSSVREPSHVTRVGDHVFFSASDPGTGRELWKTDGTAAGTVLVRDLNPGPGGSSPMLLVERNGALYFKAHFIPEPWNVQQELWRSDGTAAGTTRVATGPVDALINSAGTLYFKSFGQLVRSDGTPQGTRAIQQLDGAVHVLHPYRGGVAFKVDRWPEGADPWYSDGTPGAAVRLLDADTHTLGMSPPLQPVLAASLGDRVVFAADEASEPRPRHALWVTDGTSGGTQRAVELPAPATAMLTLAGAAYFLVDSALWRTDGTAAGTHVVHDHLRVEGNTLAVADGAIYMAGRFADDGLGIGIVRSDGTATGTARLYVLPSADGRRLPANFTAVGRDMFFTIEAAATASAELWKTDGTEAGTGMVRAFTPEAGQKVIIEDVAAAGERAIFVWRDANSPIGISRLWSSDGTSEGTFPLMLSYPVRLAPSGTAGYFSAFPYDGNTGRGLWKTDGTAAGTVLLKQGPSIALGALDRREALTVHNRLFFLSNAADRRELWTSDGTQAGTAKLATVDGSATIVGGFGGRVYFYNDDGIHGRELWSSDGTPGGTRMVHDINPGPADSRPSTAVPISSAAGNRVLFWADDGFHGTEPWTAPAPGAAFVLARHVFYNNSRFDGRDPAASTADDAAIAPDKQAMLPGGLATFDNVTSYTRGLNGIMFDVDTRLDFFSDHRARFRVADASAQGGWRETSVPVSVTRRARPDGTQRVTAVFADGAVRNAWLEVTVEAVLGDRVVATDVFYFGNLVGESGNSSRVDAADFALTRANRSTSATIHDRYDFNRDGRVDGLDLAAVRGNLFRSIDQPPIPTPATAVSSETFDARRAAPRRRTSAWQELSS